jgi:formylglycine-generating enzyme required for sulfatase activity
MGRIIFTVIFVLFSGLPFARAQSAIDQQLKEAGVCARCHVLSVMEWGMSGHRKVGTTCIGCHGPSLGHIKDERDNVKPDHIPHKAAIAALCATCHNAGCPNTKKTVDCQSCHHVHALIDPNKETTVKDDRLQQLTVKWQDAARHVTEAEKFVKAEQWEKARSEFQAALADQPDNREAAEGVKVCERRLKSAMPGFETVSKNWDANTGLPVEVKVADLGIAMMLVPGGEADIGSDKFPGAKPIHTVRVKAFYLGKYEVTQAEWTGLMGSNPSAHQYKHSERVPVNMVSWEDAQAFVKKLNEKVPGGGFRLPTEAEWEFAARDGDPVPTYPAELARLAWFDAPWKDFAPIAVGSKQPDKLGLFDMEGNVWEWCSSLYKPYPYDATDGRESLTEPGLRVLRGGGFADTADLLDPGFRHGERPGMRLPWNGLRIARTVPAN